MNPPCESLRIVVIGIGNAYRRDDGAGPAVIACLADRARKGLLPSSAVLRTGDGEPARLLSWWEGAELAVVVDAARTPEAAPGRVLRLEGAEVADVSPSCGPAGSHGLGLGEALRLARALAKLPRRLVVYGIQVEDTGFGAELTRETRAAVEHAAERIRQEILDHRGRGERPVAQPGDQRATLL